MAVNLVVGFATLLVLAFLAFQRASPRGRSLIEAPKYQPLAWDRTPGDASGARDGPTTLKTMEGGEGS